MSIQDMFIPGTGSKNLFSLVCPYCGFDYLHLVKVEHIKGGSYEAQDIYGIDVRGSVTVLHFESECEHEWKVVLGEHKGQIRGKMVLTRIPSQDKSGEGI